MIKYINSYSLSTTRSNLPLPAWEWCLSDLQASSFPRNLHQANYQTQRGGARTDTTCMGGRPICPTGGSWYRAGANKVRIRGNQDNHILGIEGVRHALRAHGERRSLEED